MIRSFHIPALCAGAAILLAAALLVSPIPAHGWSATTQQGDGIMVARDVADTATETVSMWSRSSNPAVSSWADGTWQTQGWTKVLDIYCPPSVDLVSFQGNATAYFYKITTTSGDLLLLKQSGIQKVTLDANTYGASQFLPLYVRPAPSGASFPVSAPTTLPVTLGTASLVNTVAVSSMPSVSVATSSGPVVVSMPETMTVTPDEGTFNLLLAIGVGVGLVAVGAGSYVGRTVLRG